MKKFFFAAMLAVAANFGGALFADTPNDAPFEPSLDKIIGNSGWTVVNRNVRLLNEDGAKIAHFDGNEGAGIAWLDNYQFSDGTIDFDVRGENVFQKSFVGLAFHGVGDEQYEAIYFRPFNFTAGDSIKKIHSIQYIASPTYGWQKIRAEHPGVYEQSLDPAPDPNGWFHVRVVVSGSMVSVFVNNATRPSLEVARLSDVKDGKIGMWVGDNSGGDFARLKITPAK
jgi:hypothetical protein